MDLLMDLTVKDFNNMLASKAPAPGGGSTAALAGVLASALTLMVVNLSLGKKSYELLDASIKNKIAADYEALKILSQDLSELVEEDTKAFNQVMEAMKMPRDTEEERQLRGQYMDKANLYAMQVPLQTAGKCLLVLQHQKDIALYGNKNAVSDIGVGSELAWAGLKGAELNVKINLSGINDQILAGQVRKQLDADLALGEELNRQIIQIVNERIAL
jgi:formiminotetrahydrofolate cyclodeaminase